MFLRAIQYCPTFEAYLNERGSLRMALLLNKYPGKFIDQQFNKAWLKFNINQTINVYNYDKLGRQIIKRPEKKTSIDYNEYICMHSTYCLNMRQYPNRFHTLWNKYFGESTIADIIPILGIGNVKNLQQRLINTRKWKFLKDGIT
jgi:hypothetical protein